MACRVSTIMDSLIIGSTPISTLNFEGHPHVLVLGTSATSEVRRYRMTAWQQVTRPLFN